MGILNEIQEKYVSNLTYEYQSHKHLSELVSVKPNDENFALEIKRLCDNVELKDNGNGYGSADYYLRLKPKNKIRYEMGIDELRLINEEKRKLLIRDGYIDPVDLPLNTNPRQYPTQNEQKISTVDTITWKSALSTVKRKLTGNTAKAIIGTIIAGLILHYLFHVG